MRLVPRNSSGVLNNALPYAYRSRSSRWRVRDVNLTPVVDCALDNLRNPSRCGPSDSQVLKCNDRRFVFRYDTPPAEVRFPGCVAKVVFLSGLRRKIKWRRYAFSETVNIAIAAQRGIPTPRVLAFGKLYHRYALMRATVVISEHLSQMRPLREALLEHRDDPQRAAAALMSLIPLFARVYRAGCNHIDLEPSNLLVSAADASAGHVVLDFEYAVFYDTPNPNVLMKQASQFVRRCRPFVTRFDVEDWLEALLDEVAICDAATRRRLMAQFQHHQQRHLSRRERLRTDDHFVPIPSAQEEFSHCS